MNVFLDNAVGKNGTNKGRLQNKRQNVTINLGKQNIFYGEN